MLSLCGRDWNMNEERLAMTGISKKSILDRVRLGIGGGQDLGWDFSLFFPFLLYRTRTKEKILTKLIPL